MGIFITEQMKKEAKTIMKVEYRDGNIVPYFGLGKTRQGTISLDLEIKRHKKNINKTANRVLRAVIYINHYPSKDGGAEDQMTIYQDGIWI